MKIRNILLSGLLVFGVAATGIPETGMFVVDQSVGVHDAEAAKRSSFRSSSRSSSWGSSSKKRSSSSWGSSSKPKKKKVAVKPKKKPAKKVVKPTKTAGAKAKRPVSPKVVKKPPQTTFAKAADKSKAKKALDARKASVQKARTSNKVASSLGTKTYTRTSVRSTRTTYYSSNSRHAGYRDRYESRYSGYDRGNDYGGFDPSFLMVMAMSDDPGSAALWYGMTGSPWMAIWMSDSRKAASENNDAELMARLDAIEKENAQLKAQGIVAKPLDQTLKTMGVPAEVALSTEVVTGSVLPVLRLSTGSDKGNYYAYCLALQKTLDGTIAVECITSAGSLENIKRLCLGQADAIMAQSDSTANNAACDLGTYQAEAYQEFAYLLVNREADVSGITEMDGQGFTLYVKGGSGTAGFWKGMVAQDSAYGKQNIRVSNVDSEVQAAEIVSKNPKAAMLYVSALDANVMKTIDQKYGKQVMLASVDDWSFNDVEDASGYPVYSFYDIPKGTYPALQETKGLLWGSNQNSRETLTVDALLVVSPTWANKYGEAAAQNVLSAIEWIEQYQ